MRTATRIDVNVPNQVDDGNVDKQKFPPGCHSYDLYGLGPSF